MADGDTVNQDLDQLQDMLVAANQRLSDQLGTVTDADLAQTVVTEMREVVHRIDLVQSLLFTAASNEITAAVANETKSDQSMLVIEHRGNLSAISELRLSAIGRTLRYSVPKAPKDVEVAQGPVTREQIVVAVNVK